MSDSEVEVPECCKGYAAIPDEAVRLQCVSSAIAAFRDAVEKCEAAGVGQSAPVVELRRKFTETQRYLRRLRGEPEEGDTSDEKNVGSREEGAQQEEYVMPESCKPFLSIADVTLRLKVLRQAVSGTKQAMEQAKLADTSESSQLALAERASEMEGYVQHLEEGNHNVQNSSSSSSSSSNNNNGGLAAARGDAETLEDVTGPNSEGAGQTMLDDQLLTENILEDEELLASLPTVCLRFKTLFTVLHTCGLCVNVCMHRIRSSLDCELIVVRVNRLNSTLMMMVHQCLRQFARRTMTCFNEHRILLQLLLL